MITAEQRHILQNHPRIKKIRVTRDARNHIPHLDVRVWTDGQEYLTPFLNELGLAVTVTHKGQPSMFPSCYHAIQAPTGSLVFTLDQLQTLVDGDLIGLAGKTLGYILWDAFQATHDGANAFSLPGNEYRARKIARDLVLLEAVHLENTEPQSPQQHLARTHVGLHRQRYQSFLVAEGQAA